MLRSHPNLLPRSRWQNIAYGIMSGVIWALVSLGAGAQQTNNTETAKGNKPAEQEPTGTDSPATDASDTTEAAQEQITQPLPPPTQLIYTEAVRDPLLNKELKHLRGDGQRIEMAGSLHTFSGVWQADLGGKPLGAALILTPANASPSNRELHNLQYFLALNGWASLTITSLADDPKPIPPVSAISLPISFPEDAGNSQEQDITEQDNADQEKTNTDVDESEIVYQEPDSKSTEGQSTLKNDKDTPQAAANDLQAPQPTKPPASNSELMAERIAQGLAELTKKNFFNNVLIAYDTSATYAANYLSTENKSVTEAESLRAFVFINANTHTPESRRTLDAITQLHQPTLDIINKPYPLAVSSQNERANRAKQLKHPQYIARKVVLGESNTGTENNLTRIVRGFITRHVAGTETKPAQ